FSVPARFGVRAALWLSAALHAAMLLLLAWLPRLYDPPRLGWAYWVGWAGCLALISYQHAVVRPGNLSRLDAAFFQANGALSVWLFGTTAVAILWP
ncbi:MAG: 4-hydroxybenzoate octaprenyltransferase, partial [Acidobacteria bacterium]|nr:4-hydroxybenzoate octaprenyltransferase [Acidobacteriota bacterium]